MAALFRVFPLNSSSSLKLQEGQSGIFNNYCSQLQGDIGAVVLTGDNSCGKTCLLFQAALSYSAEDAQVLYVCPKPWLKMPLCVHGMPHPDPSNLQLLRFQYMNTARELIDYCATLHKKVALPEVIIVDDLDHYSEQIKEKGMEFGKAKLCALLLDVVAHVRRVSENHRCQLLLSARDKAKFLHVVCRQFHFNMAEIQEMVSDDKLYRVNFNSWENGMSVSLSYQIKESEIFLDAVKIITDTAETDTDKIKSVEPPP